MKTKKYFYYLRFSICVLYFTFFFICLLIYKYVYYILQKKYIIYIYNMNAKDYIKVGGFNKTAKFSYFFILT